MLVYPGLETTRQHRFVNLSKSGLKVTTGFVDGRCVFRAAVKVFAKALDWLFVFGWQFRKIVRQILFNTFP